MLSVGTIPCNPFAYCKSLRKNLNLLKSQTGEVNFQILFIGQNRKSYFICYTALPNSYRQMPQPFNFWNIVFNLAPNHGSWNYHWYNVVNNCVTSILSSSIIKYFQWNLYFRYITKIYLYKNIYVLGNCKKNLSLNIFRFKYQIRIDKDSFYIYVLEEMKIFYLYKEI